MTNQIQRLSLTEFAERQRFEILATANILRMKRQLDPLADLLGLFRTRQDSNYYLRGVSFREVLPEEAWRV